MGPLLFEPFFRPQIWGGRRLETLLGKPLPPRGQYGESWEVSAHPLHVSCVRNQELAGHNLVSLWRQSKEMIWGEVPAIPDEFPWLIKFLDCNDFLSVQVHPDDIIAREFFPSERGKSEVWVIVSADPEAKVFLGLQPEITPHLLRQAIQNGDPTSCLRTFSPRPGDVFHIPPGTVHSAGGGVLIAEIQTSSDATFRLYDWNRLDQQGRPRPLHVEEAFSAIRWESQVFPFFNPEPELRSPGWISQTVASTGDFHIESWQIEPTVQIEVGISKMTIAMVLAGAVTLDTNNTPPLVLPKGETVLVPACVKSVRWSTSDETSARLLVCSPPG
ncbi:MAG: type I phosphomannose isomerase catalytic subunit [Thermogutta sp.]